MNKIINILMSSRFGMNKKAKYKKEGKELQRAKILWFKARNWPSRDIAAHLDMGEATVRQALREEVPELGLGGNQDLAAFVIDLQEERIARLMEAGNVLVNQFVIGYIDDGVNLSIEDAANIFSDTATKESKVKNETR